MKNRKRRTYETQKFRCLGCKQLVYFGSWGMCQKCVEETFKSEDFGG